jgi:hypothetical protein
MTKYEVELDVYKIGTGTPIFTVDWNNENGANKVSYLRKYAKTAIKDFCDEARTSVNNEGDEDFRVVIDIEVDDVSKYPLDVTFDNANKDYNKFMALKILEFLCEYGPTIIDNN